MEWCERYVLLLASTNNIKVRTNREVRIGKWERFCLGVLHWFHHGKPYFLAAGGAGFQEFISPDEEWRYFVMSCRWEPSKTAGFWCILWDSLSVLFASMAGDNLFLWSRNS